jgi:hypothetical protein
MTIIVVRRRRRRAAVAVAVITPVMRVSYGTGIQFSFVVTPVIPAVVISPAVSVVATA